jgi:hypothetical protein
MTEQEWAKGRGQVEVTFPPPIISSASEKSLPNALPFQIRFRKYCGINILFPRSFVGLTSTAAALYAPVGAWGSSSLCSPSLYFQRFLRIVRDGNDPST